MALQHAFLMEVHKSPTLFGRIVKILAAPNHHFYIHVDAKAPHYENYKREVEHIDNVHFIDRIAVHHGSVTQIYCELALFRAAYNNSDIDYFHLISGQDYPLRTNQQFDNFFEQHNGESFTCIEGQNYHDSRKKHYDMRTQIYCPNKPGRIPQILTRLTWRLVLALRIRPCISGRWGGVELENAS